MLTNRCCITGLRLTWTAYCYANSPEHRPEPGFLSLKPCDYICHHDDSRLHLPVTLLNTRIMFRMTVSQNFVCHDLLFCQDWSYILRFHEAKTGDKPLDRVSRQTSTQMMTPSRQTHNSSYDCDPIVRRGINDKLPFLPHVNNGSFSQLDYCIVCYIPNATRSSKYLKTRLPSQTKQYSEPTSWRPLLLDSNTMQVPRIADDSCIHIY